MSLDPDVVQALPLEDFCRALLEDSPKTSAAELREAWLEVHGEAPAKARFKAVRDRWAEARARGPTGEPGDAGEAEGQPPTLDALRDQLARAAKVGDYRACVAYASTIKAIMGLGGGGPEETEGEDWGRLSNPEAECLAALCCKLYGAPVDDEGQTWIATIAARPAAPARPHPSTIPLPPATGSGKVAG